MTARSRRVTVTTDPTQLSSSEGDRSMGSTIVLKNRDADSVFLGGADVAATGLLTGYELASGATSPVLPLLGDVLYAVVAAGTADVDVLELGV